MTTHALAPIAGYRLLEVIGVGETAAVYLAEPASADTGGAPVVVKVCRGPASDARFAECQVLLDHPVAGMPRLVDATRLPTGEQVIVMSFCSGRSLRAHSLVESAPPLPGSWASGLENLVADLHGAGVAHGGIDPGDVHVGHDGGVSLSGFGAVVRRGDAGFERARATDRSDVRRLRAEYEPASVRATVSAVAHAGTGGGEALHRGHRGSGQYFDEDAWAWREPTAEPVVEPEPTVAAVLEPAYQALVEGSRGLKALAALGVRRLPRSRQRKVLAGAAVAMVVLVGALCLTVPAQHAGGEVGADRPSSAAGAAGPETADEAEEEALQADDPVAAAIVLLGERDSCLRSRVFGCLERVDEGNSPALRLDRALEADGGDWGGRRVVGGGAAGVAGTSSGLGNGPVPAPRPVTGPVPAPVLVQRIGATAILALGDALQNSGDGVGTTKPASLLVVRGEAGWRIRSFDPV